ncbi:J domain-containing protein [Mastigocoleus testarum]|uniref:Molecular chaperone DnaJ n=1 Tax=Mastigocoleus testarum BC008 TaxID=371196 RepID=A0A0V7ZVP4_9CYAN|nr:DnaJ domain-containing protein [Mastigocoleus testarum]KST68586.1 molecular chaperone DnaJ [Mastigocoleus testarum BC008]
MAEPNHYEILEVSPDASQAEIKQAYRRLVKRYHPDTNQQNKDNERIIRINAAYEILGDLQRRQSYDRQLGIGNFSFDRHNRQTSDRRQKRAATAQQQHQAKRKRRKNEDEKIEEWLRFVYKPVSSLLHKILYSLQPQIEKLAADPFDDQLLEEFQDYLQVCQDKIKQAQNTFRSLPNPAILARAAAHLYYCLDRVGDGLNELEYFPLNYDESYLHAGQEMFRIADALHQEAQDAVNIYA